MSRPIREEITVTTDSSGDADVDTSSKFDGTLSTIIYTKSDFANGVTFAIKSKNTGQTLWSESDVDASKTVAPRQPTHDTVGGASIYTTNAPVEDRIRLANEPINIVISSGGNVASGTFQIITEPVQNERSPRI